MGWYEGYDSRSSGTHGRHGMSRLRHCNRRYNSVQNPKAYLFAGLELSDEIVRTTVRILEAARTY